MVPWQRIFLKLQRARSCYSTPYLKQLLRRGARTSPVAHAVARTVFVQAGLEPTHQVVRLARDAGFDNVHDYLVHLVTGEALVGVLRLCAPALAEFSLADHAEFSSVAGQLQVRPLLS